VDRVKNSSTIVSKVRNVINDVIWNSIQEKPEHIKNINDFKKSITLKDREALLYGIYHSTWSNEKEFLGQCSFCDKEQILKIHVDKMFTMNPYPFSDDYKNAYKLYRASGGEEVSSELEKVIRKPELELPPEIDDNNYLEPPTGKKEKNELVDEKLLDDIVKHKKGKTTDKKEKDTANKFDILSKKIHFELPESKVIAVLREPTIADEDYAYSNTSYNQKSEVDLIAQTLMIERFEEHLPAGEVNIIDNRSDIIYGFQTLPVLDRRAINDKYFNEFGQYQIRLSTRWVCKNCGEENNLNLNITAQFFRMVFSES